MINKLYTAKFKLGVKSQWTRTVPIIEIKFDNTTLYQGTLLENRQFEYESPPADIGEHRISLTFFNKDCYEQTLFGKDMMVGIEYAKLEHQPTDFSIYSRYRPDYPERWKQEQMEQGIMTESVIHSNYMGWNGVWYLDIELPIFRWIHKTTNLGWLI